MLAPNLAAMLRRRSNPDLLRPGDKVVAVRQIGDIPEGTRGVVKVVDGLTTWIRYWVAWETGEWMGSVDSAAIVAVSRLDEYRRRQAEEAEQKALAAAAPAAALPEGEAAPSGEGGRVPEHLLERSRQARARKTEQAAS
jgi:hypothetical protein